MKCWEGVGSGKQNGTQTGKAFKRPVCNRAAQPPDLLLPCAHRLRSRRSYMVTQQVGGMTGRVLLNLLPCNSSLKESRGEEEYVACPSTFQYNRDPPVISVSPPFGSKGMSLLKVFALSNQPCKQITGRPCGGPHAFAAMWPQGTKNFTSETIPKKEIAASHNPGEFLPYQHECNEVS